MAVSPDAAALVARCRELKTKLHDLLGPVEEEPLKGIMKCMGELIDVLCSSAEDDPAASVGHMERVLDHLTEMQEQLSKAVKTASGTRKLVLQLGEVTEQLAQQYLQLQQHSLQQQQQLNEHKFLAQWRDVIKEFRVRVVREVGKEYVVSTWSDMALYLKDEAKLPESQQVMTTAVKAVLQGMGLDWVDWGLLKEVADLSNTLMHGGQPTGESVSPELVDSMVMPQHLEHTRGALRKVVHFMSLPGAAPPRRSAR